MVSVVVSERTDGAGEEKVLSAPLAELTPQPTVAVVPSPEDAPCEGAASECVVSGSVDMVGAVDLLPIVGGAFPSRDDMMECLLRFNEGVLIEMPVGPVEKEPGPLAFGIEVCPFTLPDSGYGLFFFNWVVLFECDFDW